jgi:two-component system sensor histidine kinase/response regulator
MNDDREALRFAIDKFLAAAPRLLEETRKAAAAQDGPALHRAAHTVKGVVGMFCAAPAGAAARRLEILAEAGDFTQVPQARAELETELERLQAALQDLAREEGG